MNHKEAMRLEELDGLWRADLGILSASFAASASVLRVAAAQEGSIVGAVITEHFVLMLEELWTKSVDKWLAAVELDRETIEAPDGDRFDLPFHEDAGVQRVTASAQAIREENFDLYEMCPDMFDARIWHWQEQFMTPPYRQLLSINPEHVTAMIEALERSGPKYQKYLGVF